MTMVNVEVNARAGLRKFNIGTSITFDVSMDVTCENNQKAIGDALMKLTDLAIAIPDLTLTLHDGTVIKPTIHNYFNDDLVVEENE